MSYFLKHKSDTWFATTKYLADIASYGHVKCLRIDNGMEFTSEPFQQFLVLSRIKCEQLVPYSPRKNRTAEQSWRTFSLERCFLIESKLPQNLWVYTLMASAHIRNCCYNKNARKILYESFTSSKSNLNQMHIFGMSKIK